MDITIEVVVEKFAKSFWADANRAGTRSRNVHKGSSDNLIKEFRAKTNLSIRKIVAAIGINKDKIN